MFLETEPDVQTEEDPETEAAGQQVVFDGEQDSGE
jgi:hypothetical protein